MITLDRLAFVDVETTGLAPHSDRVTEIGVVTVDEGGVREWCSLVNPGRVAAARSRLLSGVSPAELAAAPRFSDIAAALAGRLAGRLFIAHNARFDHDFVRAEFMRAGLDFQARVVCSAALSRRLYPQQPRHDLDAVMHRHGLHAEARHRALPDARLLEQFWRVLRAEHPFGLEAAVQDLLAGPVLPAALDPGLIDALPESPGVFALLDREGSVLHMAKAANLRLGVRDYFRLDRASDKALAAAHAVSGVRWRVTRGALGSQFRLKAWSDALQPRKRRAAAFFTWRMRPECVPCLELAPLAAAPGGAVDRAADRASVHRGVDRSGGDTPELYGLFETERKARNALARLAASNGLCSALLGLDGEGRCVGCAAYSPGDAPACAGTACAMAGAMAGEAAARGRGARKESAAKAEPAAKKEPLAKPQCLGKRERLRHLTRVALALRPLRVQSWPYEGPIGIRERGELHVIDGWRYLGTACSAHEVPELLAQSDTVRGGAERGGFERDTFAFLVRVLRRLPASRIVRLGTDPGVPTVHWGAHRFADPGGDSAKRGLPTDGPRSEASQ